MKIECCKQEIIDFQASIHSLRLVIFAFAAVGWIDKADLEERFSWYEGSIEQSGANTCAEVRVFRSIYSHHFIFSSCGAGRGGRLGFIQHDD